MDVNIGVKFELHTILFSTLLIIGKDSSTNVVRGDVGLMLRAQLSFLHVHESRLVSESRLYCSNTHTTSITRRTTWRLERSQLLLKTTPSCFELKCRTFSLLSQCYHLVGAIPPQKNILFKALEFTASASQMVAVKLWSCNFNYQLANVLIIEGDYPSSISALQAGYVSATEISYPDLQMFFATSILYVHLMQWEDENLIAQAINQCNVICESIDPN
ncbi:hypothetical protein LWI28_026692 [Acer negundo]|uniref:Uncharacterized protein n=1 Tax=Acer negundo TaxID=4023 RepID=A0AAD5JGD5_ACENE|nr:hypothetical protein LWI28_026692 [Acer negundo]